MKIIVIGSDSFIAGRFIKKYSGNFQIKAFSRIPTLYENEKVISDLFSIPDEEFVNYEVVMNFAAIVHHPEIIDQLIYNRINHDLTIQNARKAKRQGVRLFLQMSTISVYGDSAEISLNTPYNPKTHYGVSKLKGDDSLLKLSDNSFKIAILRPPMVYGGGNAPGNMYRLIKLASSNVPLPFKNVNNKRDFINVDNLIQYLAIVLQKNIDGIFLISDKESVSTEYLLRIIYKHLKKKELIFEIPSFIRKIINVLRPADYLRLYGDLTIRTNFPCEELINRCTVEDGILEMVNYFQKNKTV